jgi:hypothetical protein
VPLLRQLPIDPETGRPHRAKIVTDNGGAFKGAALAALMASRRNCCTSVPGSRARPKWRARARLRIAEVRALYRCEIETLTDLVRQSDAYRHVFNHIRPQETSTSTAQSRFIVIRR